MKNMNKQAVVFAIWGFLFLFIGLVLLFAVDWRIAVGIFFIRWGMNLDALAKEKQHGSNIDRLAKAMFHKEEDATK